MTKTKQSIDVDVSAHSAYEQWSRFEELPRFMDGVHEVRRLDNQRLKWVGDVCGERVEWYGRITEDVMDCRLAWESEYGLVSSGVVTFERAGPEKTRVTLEIDHDEARVAEVIAGGRPAEMSVDLETFKEIVGDQEDQKDKTLQVAAAS